MIAKVRSDAENSTIMQLIKRELFPLVIKRFPNSTFNRNELKERLKAGTTYVWRERKGPIVGFIHLLERNPVLWVDMIAVNRSVQGRGIGGKLLVQAERHASVNRMHSISLFVDESNKKAKRIYESFRYELIQYHPYIHCYEYTKSLHNNKKSRP